MEKLSRRELEQPRTLPYSATPFFPLPFGGLWVCKVVHPSPPPPPPGHLYPDQTLGGAMELQRRVWQLQKEAAKGNTPKDRTKVDDEMEDFFRHIHPPGSSSGAPSNPSLLGRRQLGNEMASKEERQATVGSAKALRVIDRIPLRERLEPEVKVHATVSIARGPGKSGD